MLYQEGKQPIYFFKFLEISQAFSSEYKELKATAKKQSGNSSYLHK